MNVELQNRLLKRVFKNTFSQKKPMILEQLYAYESLKYHYKNLQNNYGKSDSTTRNKSIILPKIYKTVSNKNNYIKAIKIFYQLPNELKSLNITKRSTINKFKKWIVGNIF